MDNSVGGESSSTDNSQQSSTALLGDTPRRALSTLREEFRQSSFNSHMTNPSLDSFVQSYKSSPHGSARRLTRWRRLTSDDMDSTMQETEEDEDRDNRSQLLGDLDDDDDDDDDSDSDDSDDDGDNNNNKPDDDEDEYEDETGVELTGLMRFSRAGLGWHLAKDPTPKSEVPPLLKTDAVEEWKPHIDVGR